MNIDKNDFITLTDNIKYLVVSKIEYQNLNYLYLVDIIDKSNVKIVNVMDDYVRDIIDQKLIDELLKLFIIKLKKI